MTRLPDAAPTPDPRRREQQIPPPTAESPRSPHGQAPVARVRQDPARLEAVRATRLLDTSPEAAFDRLTRLAVAVLGVPAAFLSLVDEHRDFYKASTGLPEPLASERQMTGPTFCHHAIAGSGPLVIPDTALDSVYRDIPTVRSLGVAAYVGVPLVVDGQTVGSFCAIHTEPHAWSEGEVDVMVELAQSALREIALRRAQDTLESLNLALAVANGALYQRTRDLQRLNEQLQLQAAELDGQTEELAARTLAVEGSLADLSASEEERDRLLRESERARADAETARRDAEAANRAKSEFLATMSHELRTPLNAIGGYAEMLELGIRGPITEAQRTDLNRIKASQRHLLGLVDEVLDLARVDSGELQVARDHVRAADTFDAALALVRPQAVERGIALSDACAESEGHVYVGDEPRVRQVLVNLLANAVKFTGPGGRVHVRCAIDTAAPEDGALATGVPYVTLSVEDNGAGIEASQLSRIFEPFTQADGGLTRVQGGSGLGLAISRRLARLMGGDLTVRSRVGVGSTFTLWVPAPDPRPTWRTSDERTGERRTGAPDTREEREERRGESPSRESGSAATSAATDRTSAVSRVGAALVPEAGAIVAEWMARLRASPHIPGVSALAEMQLEDHSATLVTDVALALRWIGHSATESAELLRDGTAILGFIAERRGASRARMGWPASAIRHEFVILREVMQEALRRLATGAGAEDRALADAMSVVTRLLDQASRLSLGGYRLAMTGAAGHGR